MGLSLVGWSPLAEPAFRLYQAQLHRVEEARRLTQRRAETDQFTKAKEQANMIALGVVMRAAAEGDPKIAMELLKLRL